MKIIIAGAGRIGSNLAKTLSEENHEVYLIEINPDVARKADEKIDAKVIVGSGADPDILKLAKIEQTDLVIAVTFSDEINLVICSLAAYFGSKRQVARVRTVSLSQEIREAGYRHFNIDEIINPEEVTAQAIYKTIETPGAREVGDFAEGKILLRAFDIPERSPFIGMKIEDFRDEDFPWPFLVIAISRNRLALIPKGDTCIESFDRIYVLLPAPSLGEFISFVDPETKKPNKVIISGATNIGEHLARALSEDIPNIVFIEETKSRATHIAGKFDGVRVIHGSASEKDILTECGVEAADFFVATSNNDHSNLISAVLAKKMGAKSTIITTQQPDYMSIVDALDIDVIINPHMLAVEQILSVVRGKGISAVTKLLEGDAEALEFIPEKGSAVTKAPIKEINFPKNSIVGAVCRGSEVILANGDTQIQEGEKVIVFCQQAADKKLQALFTHKTLF